MPARRYYGVYKRRGCSRNGLTNNLNINTEKEGIFRPLFLSLGVYRKANVYLNRDIRRPIPPYVSGLAGRVCVFPFEETFRPRQSVFHLEFRRKRLFSLIYINLSERLRVNGFGFILPPVFRFGNLCVQRWAIGADIFPLHFSQLFLQNCSSRIGCGIQNVKPNRAVSASGFCQQRIFQFALLFYFNQVLCHTPQHIGAFADVDNLVIHPDAVDSCPLKMAVSGAAQIVYHILFVGIILNHFFLLNFVFA